MNKKRRNNKSKFLLVLLLLGLTVGFALLTATLNINGNGKINKATWNIHWDNIEVKKGSAQASTPAYIVDNKKTIVEYSVTFEQPGDFYEFTVDAVNDGTIDGQVSVVSNEILDANDEVITPSYITSSVTYSDGQTIEPDNLLKVGRSEKYKVRVTYDTDDVNDLIANDTEFKFRFSVTYVQSDTSGSIRDGICNASIYDDGDLTESRYLDKCESYIDEDIYTYTTNNDDTLTITGFKDGYTIQQVKSGVRDLKASKLLNDKDLEVRKVDNKVISFKDGVWAIPLTIDGKKVTKITEDAFNDLSINAELVLPPTLKETEDGSSEWSSTLNKTVYVGAFANNNITAVGMPYNIIKIGTSTFAANKLTKAEVRDSVQELGRTAFADMSTLTSVQIGSGLDEIGAGAFASDGITELTVPGNVKTVASGAFSGNPISTLELEEGVQQIQGGAFSEAVAKKIVIPNSVTTIQPGGFYGAPVEELIIGDGLTQLGYGDFSFNNLKKLVVGNGMIKIGAIGNTPDLVELDLGNSVQSITDGSFYSCKVNKIVIPDSVTVLNNSSFSGCAQTEEIIIGDGLTRIEAGAFNGLTGLRKLKIGNSMQIIQAGAFSGSSNLKEIDWGTSLTTITGGAMSGVGIERIEFPDSVTTVNQGAFSGSPIKYLDTGNGLTSIDSSAWGNINTFETVILGDSVQSINSGTFNGKPTLTSVTFGSSLTSIPTSAFLGDNLSTVDLSRTQVSSIGYAAFKDNNITNLRLSDNLESIGEAAFSGNDISDLKLPDTIKVISDYAFAYNSISDSSVDFPEGMTYLSGFNDNNFTTVDVPSTVTTIGIYAFQSNDNLSRVNIPNSVTEIKREAFNGCLLSSITLPNSLVTIGDQAFNNNRLTSISIPGSVQNIGAGAFAANRITGNDAFMYKLENGVTDNTVLSSYAGYGGNVTLPSTVTKIDKAAFFATFITGISNYSQVTEIGEYAFGNTSIPSFTVPSAVTEIPLGLFFSTNQLHTVNLGNVTSIGRASFQYSRLNSLTIPSTVTDIGSNAFYKDSNSNPNLNTIVNASGNAFRWDDIINGSGSQETFVTGTVTNSAGDVTITN